MTATPPPEFATRCHDTEDAVGKTAPGSSEADENSPPEGNTGFYTETLCDAPPSWISHVSTELTAAWRLKHLTQGTLPLTTLTNHIEALVTRMNLTGSPAQIRDKVKRNALLLSLREPDVLRACAAAGDALTFRDALEIAQNAEREATSKHVTSPTAVSCPVHEVKKTQDPALGLDMGVYNEDLTPLVRENSVTARGGRCQLERKNNMNFHKGASQLDCKNSIDESGDDGDTQCEMQHIKEESQDAGEFVWAAPSVDEDSASHVKCEQPDDGDGSVGISSELLGTSSCEPDSVHCEACGRRFSWTSRREVSAKKHFVCEDCEKRFEADGQCTESVFSHCGACGERFAETEALTQHVRNHVLVYQCDNCDGVFADFLAFRTHVLEHVCEAKSFQYRPCQRDSSEDTTGVNHATRSSKRRQLNCEKNGQEFNRAGLVNDQPRVDDKPNRCSECDKVFSSECEPTTQRKTHGDQRFHSERGQPDEDGGKHTEEKPLQCDVCDRTFTRKANLKLHKVVHTVKKLLKCDQCDKTFATSQKLKVHALRHGKDMPFHCETCGRKYVTAHELRRHQKRHSETHNCEKCGRGFRASNDLRRHRFTHSEERPFQCDMCGKAYKQVGVLIQHRRTTHLGLKLFKCERCDKTFVRGDKLKIHMRTHTGEKPHQCDTCGKSFSQITHLNTHRRTHTGERPYVCDMCGMKFTQTGTLTLHKMRHAGVKPYQCEECGVGFVVKSKLVEHQWKSHGIGNSVTTTCDGCGKECVLNARQGPKTQCCPQCGKEFCRTTQKNVVSERIQCDLCDKTLASKTSLYTHKLMVHSEGKPHKCDTCDKAFRAKQQLEVHRRTHTGEKPYRCELCLRAFASRANHKRHMETHTDQRRFHCDLCDKSFRQKTQLQTHRNVHTGAKPFQCDSCEKAFSDRSTLHKHKKNHTKQAT